MRRLIAYAIVVLVAGAICALAYRDREPEPLTLDVEIIPGPTVWR